ncbi:MAG: PEP-CTERM sorting domain-containing protein [Planctomycetota bacterium]|nr:PEP-CTERM sorting domain-containing protein [Planctomycetota bacterium]
MKIASITLAAVALLAFVAPAGAVDVPKGCFGSSWDLPNGAGTFGVAYSDVASFDCWDAIGGGTPLTPGAWMHMEWRVDLTNSTGEFYANGELKSRAAQAFANGAPLDFAFYISTGLNGADMPFDKPWYADNITVVKDGSTIYNEDFQSYAVGSAIVGQGAWTSIQPGDEWYVRTAPGGSKAFELTDQYVVDSSIWVCGAVLTFPAFAGDFQTGTMNMSWDLYVPTVGVTPPEWPNYLPGDFNKDGEVGPEDFGILKDNFGIDALPFGNHESWTLGDANDDGEIGPEDFGLLKDNFGLDGGPTGTYPLTNVPEPTTLALLALAGLAIRRKRA